MIYRFCGHSGLKLPVISLGLWHNFGYADPYGKAEETLLKAFENGVTHFDLANNYGPPPGSAEENFGRMLRTSLASHRDELVITSKAGHLMWDGPYGEGGSRKHLMASIDQSLRRTGLEYFDIFYSHRHCPETPLEETVQALIDIVKRGKALYVGLSKYPVEVAEEACMMMREQHVECLVYQDRFNMLSRGPESRHFDLVRRQGMGFVAFSPLAQGLLTDRYLNGIPEGSRAARPDGFLKASAVTPGLVERLRLLDTMARDRGQTLAQMALTWLIGKEGLTSVIVGASSPAQLADTLRAVDATPLSPDELLEIDRILDAEICG